MNATAFVVAAPCIVLVPLPTPELWRILVLAMLVHGFYPFFLVGAYRQGDLSTVFPMARGPAPLGVTFLAAVATGDTVSWAQVGAITIISAGVMSLAFERAVFSDPSHWRGVVLALVTGAIISVYTVIDAIGLRVVETMTTYVVWLFVLDGLFVSIAAACIRRNSLVPFLRLSWKPALVGGVLGVTTYGLALYALGLGAIAEIAALRETSIVFAAMLGTLFLGEVLGLLRIFAATVVTAGGIALKAV